jgi:mRNA interferase MazF
MVKRFEVYLINLDPDPSDDPRNMRPAVVVSPDEMNSHLAYATVAPMTAAGKTYPTRVPVDFLNGERSVVLDQIRTIDRARLVKKIGEIDEAARKTILNRLQEMFAE